MDNGGKLEGTINGNQPPKITTERLNDGTVNTTYNQTLVASGDATITWSSSDLPNWLTLNSDGTISGTPTAAGTYSFTVTATNDYGGDSKEFTLTIDQQGTIHVTSVSLDKTSLELTEGGTGTLIATVEPNNATNRNVTWESSNTKRCHRGCERPRHSRECRHRHYHRHRRRQIRNLHRHRDCRHGSRHRRDDEQNQHQPSLYYVGDTETLALTATVAPR